MKTLPDRGGHCPNVGRRRRRVRRGQLLGCQDTAGFRRSADAGTAPAARAADRNRQFILRGAGTGDRQGHALRARLPAPRKRLHHRQQPGRQERHEQAQLWRPVRYRFSPFITEVRGRRFPLVDEERGLVLAFLSFDHSGRIKSVRRTDGTVAKVPPPFDTPYTFLIAELFKIRDGRIAQVEPCCCPLPMACRGVVDSRLRRWRTANSGPPRGRCACGFRPSAGPGIRGWTRTRIPGLVAGPAHVTSR